MNQSLQWRRLWVFLLLLVPGATFASDHNNVDRGRPLRFEDATSVAFGERTFEFGLSLDTFLRSAPTYGFSSEYKTGFAKNRDIGISYEPSLEGDTGRQGPTRVGLSYFESLRREIANEPALAYRMDVGLPAGGGAEGVSLRVTGILSKALSQYDRLHLNVAYQHETAERADSWEGVLGYSTPLGYPRRFDRTLLAEFALRQTDGRPTGTVGLGLRVQSGFTTVLDLGIESDLFGPNRTPFRLAAGLSVSF